MPDVSQLLERKGKEVVSIKPGASVQEAATLMNEHKIGALVVDDGGRVAGMFTERDVLRRVVAEREDPAATKVADVMTTEVICCHPDTKIDQARSILMNRRIRHLPVVDEDEQLIGLISIGDLNAWELDGRAAEIHILHEYIYGRV